MANSVLELSLLKKHAITGDLGLAKERLKVSTRM